MSTPIWQPSEKQKSSSHLSRYHKYLENNFNLTFTNYPALHEWSISNRSLFWQSLWDFCEVIGEPGEQALIEGSSMLEDRFFPNGQLNFAENLLRRRDSNDALVFSSEGNCQQRISWQSLYDEVSRLRQALTDLGVKPGDRVAAYIGNTPEAVIAMLASTSLGAIWCSCSPDFGAAAVIDRFEQIQPQILFAQTHYNYAGKAHLNSLNINNIAKHINSIHKIIMTPCKGQNESSNISPEATISWHQLLKRYQPQTINFKAFPFHHPLYIMFSSGTTGVPKCIVHSAGGTLLQHLKEHQLHCDIKPEDRIFYYTTTSWMMWHWLISGLASQATLLLYDGCPSYPDDLTLFRYIDTEKGTLFGTSAKFIDHLSKHQTRPGHHFPLDNLRTVTSTGSPLSPEHFDYVYQHLKSDVQLSSISGGTDIISCFVLGNPMAPIYRGEITCPGLGMAVEIWNQEGKPVKNEKGELVCISAFPSMPLGFWNDEDHSKYHKAYFSTYDNIWSHGDFAEQTDHQGFIIYGRSDTTLNPGGVRIGSAEIYRQVEKIPEVLDSLAIDHSFQGDKRIILFIKLVEGKLDTTLSDRIKAQIRRGATARHVPALICQVADIPRTRSGKLAETAIKEMFENRPIANQNSLANPEALEGFRELFRKLST